MRGDMINFIREHKSLLACDETSFFLVHLLNLNLIKLLPIWFIPFGLKNLLYLFIT